MKLSCLKENLAAGLGIVGKVVPSKSTLPVLSNVLLATEHGQLKLVGTDLEMAISHWVGAKVEAPGAVTLPARLLSELVGYLPNDRVDLELEPGTQTVRIACGRTEAKLRGIAADEFPSVVAGEPTTVQRVATAALRQGIEQVAFAAAADDSRPVLAGVLLEFTEDRLRLVAADGFRLALRTVRLEGAVTDAVRAIVPARGMRELARILPEDEGEQVEVGLVSGRNQVVFRFPRTEVVARLVEGQFPDYQRILPRSFVTRAVLSGQEFLQAIRLASVIAQNNNHIVYLDLHPSGEDLAPGRVLVRGRAAEVGEDAAELDASIEGQAMEIAFNGKYLRDALESLKGGDAALEISGATSPGILRPVADEEYLHVIMPIHLK